MSKCAECGEAEYLLFRCKYCGLQYCAKHRLPESHNCFSFREALKKHENDWKRGEKTIKYKPDFYAESEPETNQTKDQQYKHQEVIDSIKYTLRKEWFFIKYRFIYLVLFFALSFLLYGLFIGRHYTDSQILLVMIILFCIDLFILVKLFGNQIRPIKLTIIIGVLAFSIYSANLYSAKIFDYSTTDQHIANTDNSISYQHPTLKPEIKIDELEKQIHDLINQERLKQGLSELQWNLTLNKIARKHSEDMATRGYFDHITPEGEDVDYRYKQEGYNCAVDVGSLYYIGAENILQNNLYDSVTYVYLAIPIYNWNSQDHIAKTTVEEWMNSPGHRKNILEPFWKTQGIGVAVSSDDKVYVTENFC